MKETMIIYSSWIERFRSLTDEQFGQLMRAAMQYDLDRTLPEFEDQIMRLSFDVIKFDLDRNAEKYAEIIEKRKEAGRKGAEAKKANATKCQQLPNEESKIKQNKQTEANQAVSVSDSVSDSDSVISLSGDKNARERDDPTIEDVRAYFSRMKKRGADSFYKFYKAAGWKDTNGKRVISWQQKAEAWKPPDLRRVPDINQGDMELEKLEDLGLQRVRG